MDVREAIVFDFVEGVSGFRYLLRNPWRLKEFAIDFAAIHARMHAITVPETVPVLKSILIRNMNLHDLLPPETKERIIEYLGVLPDGNALCHGDYHPDNLLLQGRTPFVLDWMTATRGNPLADVARTVILLKWAQPGPGTPLLARTMLGAIRQRFCQHYLTHYRGLTGARMDEIDRWELPVLAARLMEWIPKSEKKLFVSIIAEKLKQI